jgi:acetoacetyl-CoA reductase
MTPLLSNVYTLQFELFNQWYKSYGSTKQIINNLIDTSHELVSHVTRQQHRDVDSFLDSLSRAGKTGHIQSRQIKTGTAVITGGTGGIGTAISRKLATSGNRIIATYIPVEEKTAVEWKRDLESEGYQVDIHECDVSDYESCRNLSRLIEEKYGAVDILVNAAGITRDAILKKMEPGQWHSVLDTNLDSVFNVTHNFIQGMINNGYGRIINISSVNGQKGQFGQTNYSTAKAGMIGFTRSLALELAGQGITVNCVCPGYVGTPMVEAIRQDVLDTIIQQIPVGRLAKPEEIAHAVAFLADRNSAYITGTELAVNGGLWTG